MNVIRWHPANKGDVPSLPKLRINNNAWGRGPELDGFKWSNFHHEWLVDDDNDSQRFRYSNPRDVIRRVRAIGDGGVIQLVNPFVDFPGVQGQPEPFGPEWATKMRDILRLAYKDLRGLLRMSAREIDRIHWLLDHERWEQKSYSDKQTPRPWAEHAIEWTVWALREAGFDGPVSNHATGVDRTHGRCAQTKHPALSMPHLSGYAHEDFIYTAEEICVEIDALCGRPFLYTHNAKNDPDLIDHAKKCGGRVLRWN